MLEHSSDSHLTPRARRMRREPTWPERIVWDLVRGGRLAGLKFRRQQPIGPYIVDFYCHEVRLVVEVDGISHVDQVKADAQRQRDLEARGARVLRLDNDDVLQDQEAVARAILRAAGCPDE